MAFVRIAAFRYAEVSQTRKHVLMWATVCGIRKLVFVSRFSIESRIFRNTTECEFVQFDVDHQDSPCIETSPATVAITIDGAICAEIKTKDPCNADSRCAWYPSSRTRSPSLT